MPDITKLSANKLEALAAKLAARSSAATTALINAGYGLEKCSDTMKRAALTGDPLAVEYAAAIEAERPVIEEKAARKRWHGSLNPIKREHD